MHIYVYIYIYIYIYVYAYIHICDIFSEGSGSYPDHRCALKRLMLLRCALSSRLIFGRCVKCLSNVCQMLTNASNVGHICQMLPASKARKGRSARETPESVWVAHWDPFSFLPCLAPKIAVVVLSSGL